MEGVLSSVEVNVLVTVAELSVDKGDSVPDGSVGTLVESESSSEVREVVNVLVSVENESDGDKD